MGDAVSCLIGTRCRLFPFRLPLVPLTHMGPLLPHQIDFEEFSSMMLDDGLRKRSSYLGGCLGSPRSGMPSRAGSSESCVIS